MLTWNAEAFLKMKRLRLLKVSNLPPNPRNLKYLSDKLRLLDWSGYPFRSLPSSFQPDNLVALLLPYSRIQQLPWKGNISLEKLKLVNLKGSENLIRTPDFTMAPNLETLILEGCTSIVDVHPSIGRLGKLEILNLKDCKSLRRFPSSSMDGLKCLKTIDLSGCSKLENLPESLQQVESLEELDLSGTAITKPPSFIFQFKNLKRLSFRGCKGPPPSNSRPNLLSLFKVMQRGGASLNSMADLTLPPLSGLTCLRELNISYCNLGEGAIPSDICHLSSLRELNLSGNTFSSLPANLDRLSSLEYLGLTDCTELKSLPELLTLTTVLGWCGAREPYRPPGVFPYL